MKYDEAHIKLIQQMPHWRIVVRPDRHEAERIPTLSACWKLIEKRRLMLRGWDYPHLDTHNDGQENGANWIASGSAWGRHFEYWKLFQSGQFVHLLALHEATAPDHVGAAQKAAAEMPGGIPETVKGSVNILWLLHTVTEVHMFAASLAAEGDYAGNIAIELQLVNAAGFILTADSRRAWWLFCQNTQNPLGREWTYTAETLVKGAGPKALDATSWFLERFGWRDPNIQQLQGDQEKLLRREF